MLISAPTVSSAYGISLGMTAVVWVPCTYEVVPTATRAGACRHVVCLSVAAARVEVLLPEGDGAGMEGLRYSEETEVVLGFPDVCHLFVLSCDGWKVLRYSIVLC